jgi:hypothetical protein
MGSISIGNFPMSIDPELYRHKQWLGLLQPVGLVVSPIALSKAGVVADRERVVDVQQTSSQAIAQF